MSDLLYSNEFDIRPLDPEHQETMRRMNYRNAFQSKCAAIQMSTDYCGKRGRKAGSKNRNGHAVSIITGEIIR